ncbi:MAG: DoxX family protein [Planctomycetota bacterium]
MNSLIRRLQLDFFPTKVNCAILLLRVALGAQMLLGHGWGKFMTFSEKAATFPDPLGVGHTTSMALAVFGEVVCSVLLIAGAFTRLAALGGAVTMAVAFFLVHGGKLSGANSGEMAFLYLVGFVAIFLTGPGLFALDTKLGGQTNAAK